MVAEPSSLFVELQFCFGGEPKRTSGASQAAELMSVAQDGSDKPVSMWGKSGFSWGTLTLRCPIPAAGET